MTTLYILLAIIIILLLIVLLKPVKGNEEKFDALQKDIQRIEESVKKEISLNRIETNNQSLRARQELAASI